MLSTPIALGLLSAVTVAFANFFVKRGGDVLTARMVMSIAMGLTVAPFVFLAPPPGADAWGPLLFAVLVHWVYQFAMIRALHRGDLSLVFPVMRGLSPAATAALAVFFLGERLSPTALAGLLTACGALIAFALPDAQSVGARRLNRAALIWAVATAAGIGAYSVVDAGVARMMPDPLTFVVWLFLLDWIGVTAVALWTRRGRIIASVRPQLKSGLAGGFVGAVSYGAAIYAFTMMDAAMVTALRETSVFFAALLGAFALKEGFGRRRIVAAGFLAAGLFAMQAG